MKFSLIKPESAYAEYVNSIEAVSMSHLIIALRTATANGPTLAQLKASKLRVVLNVAGVGTSVLVESNLHDLAFLTDALGGFGADFTGTAKNTVNIAIPMGFDLGPGQSLDIQLTPDSPHADTKMLIATIDTGDRPRAFRYTTITTKGNISASKAVQVFVRDYGSETEIRIKEDGRDTITFPLMLGSAAFCVDTFLELPTLFSRVYQTSVPTGITIMPPDTLTAFIVEAA